VSKIGTFARYLREMFRADNDAATLRLAAETLGRLVAAGGALTADVVEQEVYVQTPGFRCSGFVCVNCESLNSGQGVAGPVSSVQYPVWRPRSVQAAPGWRAAAAWPMLQLP
jgi:hypothetical protein